jgi:hypothetical protein
MFAVAERLKGRIDATAANRVCWGSGSVLVTAVSHFGELDADLEVLESECNAGLMEGEVDTLWSQVHVAVKSLASHIPSLVACNPLDSTRE